MAGFGAEELWKQLHYGVRRFVQRVRVRRGHFSSPYPDMDQLRRHEAEIFASPSDYPGLDLREDAQLELLDELAEYYGDLPFDEHPSAETRYYYGNRLYSFSDGILTATLLRHLRPQRYLEIGSGYSSALALDIRRLFLDGEMEVTCVDPHPERLKKVLRGRLLADMVLLEERVQDVDRAIFDELSSGDVLFIDGTHVAKPGADVNHLMFEVLPSLESGVLVHFHDIFVGFEYPREWVYQGRIWNEAYVLRAFLQHNNAFEVMLWTVHA